MESTPATVGRAFSLASIAGTSATVGTITTPNNTPCARSSEAPSLRTRAASTNFFSKITEGSPSLCMLSKL